MELSIYFSIIPFVGTALISVALGLVIWRARDGAEWLLFASLPVAVALLQPVLTVGFRSVLSGEALALASVVTSTVTAVIATCIPLFVIWRGLPARGQG